MFIALAAAVGQEPAGFHSRVDVVAVYATVHQADGRLVRDLEKSDFEILENGKPREIVTFSNDVQPVTLAILFDRSSSVERQSGSIAAAAAAAISTLLPPDRVSISSLTWDCLPLTLDKPAALAMLRSQLQGDIGTPLWAGLDRVLSSLALESGRRAILVFSDGHDNPQLQLDYMRFQTPGGFPSGPLAWPGPCHLPNGASLAATSEQVLRRIDRDGPAVYVVRVGTLQSRNDTAPLRSMARNSDGGFYELSDDSVTSALARIGLVLHNQYLLGFVPVAFDGKVHDIAVRLRRPGLVVQARKTFFAAKSQQH